VRKGWKCRGEADTIRAIQTAIRFFSFGSSFIVDHRRAGTLAGSKENSQ